MRPNDLAVHRRGLLAETPSPDSTLLGHFAFHVDAESPDRILFSTDRHLYLSSDGGATWSATTGIEPTSRVKAGGRIWKGASS